MGAITASEKHNTMSTKRKITLTDERPVLVTDEEWPVVASASHDKDGSGNQANRRQYMRVRQHADGRCLVYGWSESSWQGEHGRQAGFRATPDDCPRQLRMVAGLVGIEEWLVMQCISDLPAQDDVPPVPLRFVVECEGGGVQQVWGPPGAEVYVYDFDEDMNPEALLDMTTPMHALEIRKFETGTVPA